jgi:hypothetical protein
MSLVKIFIALIGLHFACLLNSLAQVFPAMPETGDVITCFPDTAGYERITVGPFDRDYSDLQEAIDAAPLGSVLVLDAGVSFNGGFVLPDKGEGEEWIVLISSRMDLLTGDETRADPSEATGDPYFPDQASAMPKIITVNTSGIPCFATQASAHHYRLVGLEITADVNVINSYGLINLGTSAATQNSFSKVPHHFIIDRCYIHGHDEAEIMKYGVRLDCSIAAIIDSYIAEFHSVGFDAQAISGINGPGPFKIINNYLEASGENILFGGAAPAIPGLVPSDIEIRQNYFYKPWSWRVGHPDYAGKHWTVKNLFELKTGKRVLVDGNIMENCWADLPIGQSGYAILLTVRNEGGASPQADVSDIMISNNIIRHAGAGISLSGSDGAIGNRSARIMIYNNLFDDISGPAYGDLNVAGPNDGTFLKIGNPRSAVIDHNSVFQTGPITWAYQVTDTFVYTNNITHCFISDGGYQGIYGPGQSQGNSTFAQYFPGVTDANMQFHQNVLIGGNAARYTNFLSLSLNYFPVDADAVGFAGYDTGMTDYHGYELTPVSPYYQAGSGGKDIGVDFQKLDSAFISERGCGEMSTAIDIPIADHSVVQLSPNPAKEFIRLNLNDNGFSHYKIFDVHSRCLMSGRLEDETEYIKLQDFAAGVYFICLYTEERREALVFLVD